MNREAELLSSSHLLVIFEKPSPDVKLRRELSKLLPLEQQITGLRGQAACQPVPVVPQR